MDKITATQRSDNMRAIKSKDTGPEKAVRSLLHRLGYRFRLHRAGLPGKPDIVLPRHNKVIFVQGCFWHGHHCKQGLRLPKTNSDYWREKIAGNRARDARHAVKLTQAGWTVLEVWECEVGDTSTLAARFNSALAERQFLDWGGEAAVDSKRGDDRES
jgi:DNA mismatch endonuclease, patch repair protein